MNERRDPLLVLLMMQLLLMVGYLIIREREGYESAQPQSQRKASVKRPHLPIQPILQDTDQTSDPYPGDYDDPNCPYCTWFRSTASGPINIRRSVSQHIRQAHPNAWLELSRVRKELRSVSD